MSNPDPKRPIVSGSEVEPTPLDAEQAAEQMRDATERLREQGWMVAPVTSPGAAVIVETAPENQPDGR